jgi:hypothetical protein
MTIKKELERIREWVKKKNESKNENAEFKKTDETWQNIGETMGKFGELFKQLNKEKQNKNML